MGPTLTSSPTNDACSNTKLCIHKGITRLNIEQSTIYQISHTLPEPCYGQQEHLMSSILPLAIAPVVPCQEHCATTSWQCLITSSHCPVPPCLITSALASSIPTSP